MITCSYRDSLTFVIEKEEEISTFHVELVDNSVAKIYAKSKRGKVNVHVMVNIV